MIMTESPVWHTILPTELTETRPELAVLMTANSLTAALSRLQAVFSVRLLGLGDMPWRAHEAGALGLAAGAVYGREVLLCLDNTPVVWARSVCAPEAANWREVLDCGTQSLGARLFDGSLPLQRTPFDYTCAVWPDSGEAQAVWLRRSRFDWRGAPLLLSEAFLPALTSFLPSTP